MDRKCMSCSRVWQESSLDTFNSESLLLSIRKKPGQASFWHLLVKMEMRKQPGSCVHITFDYLTSSQTLQLISSLILLPSFHKTPVHWGKEETVANSTQLLRPAFCRTGIDPFGHALCPPPEEQEHRFVSQTSLRKRKENCSLLLLSDFIKTSPQRERGKGCVSSESSVPSIYLH